MSNEFCGFSLGDPYISDVVFGMHMDGANDGTVFTDVTGKTITRFSAVTKTATKRFGTASGYFSGTDTYLTATTGAEFDFGTGDFTIEVWVYPTNITTNRYILAKSVTWATNLDFGLYYSSTTGAFRFVGGDNAPISISADAAPTINNWYHVAVTRSSGVTRLFINGAVQSQTHTGSVSIPNDSTTLIVGNYITGTGGTERFYGYLDDIRITKGVARYTSSFTPPTQAFPDPDPFYSSVVLGMHMDGTDNGTVFTDVTGKTVTRVGVVTKTATKMFGTASAYFDGVDANNNRLYLADSDDWHWGSSPYTIEMWVMSPSWKAGNQWLLQQSSLTGAACPLRIDINSANFAILGSTDNTTWAINTTIPYSFQNNVWYHLGFCDDGTNFRAFVNGVVQYSVGTWAKIQIANELSIGGGYASGDREFYGYIDDLRITKGVARYTNNFIPPTQAFPSW